MMLEILRSRINVTAYFYKRIEVIKSDIIWTTLFWDNLLDNQSIQRNLGIDRKTKEIKRESKNTM